VFFSHYPTHVIFIRFVAAMKQGVPGTHYPVQAVHTSLKDHIEGDLDLNFLSQKGKKFMILSRVLCVCDVRTLVFHLHLTDLHETW
jgi:hypothetical protein